jgi:hypothetical protein
VGRVISRQQAMEVRRLRICGRDPGNFMTEIKLEAA